MVRFIRFRNCLVLSGIKIYSQATGQLMTDMLTVQRTWSLSAVQMARSTLKTIYGHGAMFVRALDSCLGNASVTFISLAVMTRIYYAYNPRVVKGMT